MGVFNSHIYIEGDRQRERFAALFFILLLISTLLIWQRHE